MVQSARERRLAIQAHAASLQIDDAYISTLVETFYERVRAHPTLGPIFNTAIEGDWGPHLQTMKDFWASVAMNAARYSGQPVPKHRALNGVEPGHFDIWLGLFEETLRDTTRDPRAVDYFMERARRIAESLKLAMFSLPALQEVRSGP